MWQKGRSEWNNMCKVILKHRNPNGKFKRIILGSAAPGASSSPIPGRQAVQSTSYSWSRPALLCSPKTLVGVLTKGFSNPVLFSVFSHEYTIGSYSDSNSLQSSSPVLGNIVDSA